MKTFNAPAIDIEKFMIADVIAASNENEGGEGGGNLGENELPEDRG